MKQRTLREMVGEARCIEVSGKTMKAVLVGPLNLTVSLPGIGDREIYGYQVKDGDSSYPERPVVYAFHINRKKRIHFSEPVINLDNSKRVLSFMIVNRNALHYQEA